MAKKPTKPTGPDIAVVMCHFNPCRYEAPIGNACAATERLEELAIPYHLITCEFAGEDQNKAQLGSGDHRFSKSVLWQKEALLNAAVAKLPPEVTKVIAMDADILIPDALWLGQVSAALDTHPIVQPWKRAIIMGPDDKEARCVSSVAYGHSLKDKRASDHTRYHPGYCWAMRRTFWTEGKGLPELCPVGGGDQELAREALTMPGFGYVNATITALYHGAPENRKYLTRLELLKDFDPTTDIEPRTEPGPLEWTNHARRHKHGMVQAIANYFGSRQEDGGPPPEPPPPPMAAPPDLGKDDPAWIFGDSVEQRNALQRSGKVHPKRCACQNILTATDAGWTCDGCTLDTKPKAEA